MLKRQLRYFSISLLTTIIKDRIPRCSSNDKAGSNSFSFFPLFAPYRLLLTPFCLLLTAYCFISCAPKAITPLPPQYREELTLAEIVSRASDGIQVLKAIADIRIEKNSEFYDQINASVIFQKPDRAHMRMYKFGMLVSDIVMKDRELYVLTGNKDTKLAGLIEELLFAVFWWDDVEGGVLSSEQDAYIIRTVSKEIYLDKATLLPLRQDIISSGKTVYVKYAEPHNYEGFWYPSKLELSVDDFRFSVKIDKLIKNPPLGEYDFKIPS